MPRLPVVSGAEMVRALERAGWQVKRQRGSHIVLTKPGMIASLSVPQHSELAPGTLRSLIRSSGLSVEELRDLL